MSQDVTISTANSSIFCLGTRQSIGAKMLTISGDDVLLFNIRLSGASGAGIVVSGQRCRIIDCLIQTNGGIGISLAAGDYHLIQGCTIYDNGDDGVAIADGVIAWLLHNRIQANDAWGVDDDNVGDNVIYIANNVTSNTSGQLSTNATSAYKIANRIT